MNPRKRQALEPLLPLRSAKQRRTTLKGHSGGNPSPSEAEGILSRWVVLWKEAVKLGRDTFIHLVEGIQTEPIMPYSCPPPPHSRSSQPLPQHPPPISALSYRKPPSPFPSSTDFLVPSRQKSECRESSDSQTKLPLSSSTLQQPDSRKTSDSHIIPPSSINTISSSAVTWPSMSQIQHSYPQIDEALATSQNAQRQQSTFSNGIPRTYTNREHIFAKTHKVKVQADRKKAREEMQKELYRYKKTSGYVSDYPTFLSYLSYRERLEKLEKREALSPSPSLTDLRSKPFVPDRSRRHSDPKDLSVTFLQRALDRARETLNGPKPPKPFAPSFDQLQLFHRVKDEEIERRLRGPKRIPLPSSLPPEDDAKVESLLRQRGVISKFAKEQVTDHDLVKLKPCQWLNDEIINFYGSMILARSDGCKENPGPNGVAMKRKKPLNIHYFSTFFWSKLKGEGYEKARLAKWTKKFDLFAKDVVLIPVNHNNSHWTGAAINFRKKRIESYDSMGMERKAVFKLLRSYLDSEHRNKKKKPFDFTGWVDYVLEDTPQQENGFDCGVFTCQFLESLSRGEETFNFTQSDMLYLRRRMIWEIGNATLRDDP